MPLHSFFDWASGTPHPCRRFHLRARMDVVGNRSPLPFPLYVGNWYRGDRARHHYGTRVLSIRGLLRQERAMIVVRWTWWVYAARRGREVLANWPVAPATRPEIPSLLHFSLFLSSSHHGPPLPYTHLLILSPSFGPFRNKLFKFRYNHLQSVPQWSDIWLPPVLIGL